MKPRNVFHLLLITSMVFLFPVDYLCAQNDPGKWDLSFMGGIPFTYFNEGSLATPVVALDIGYKINPLISLQVNFGKGVFKSKHVTNYFGRTFHNSYLSAAIGPQLNFFKILDLGRITNSIGLLGFAGIGLLKNDVQTTITNKATGWEYFKGINNRNVVLSYSFGASLKINLSRRLSFLIRYEYNFSNSDYIDGYTTVKNMNISDFGTNNYSNDNYSFLTAGISINIGKHQKTNTERKIDDLEKYYQFDSQKIIQLEKNMHINVNKLNELNKTVKKISEQNKKNTSTLTYDISQLKTEVSKIQFKIDSLSGLLESIRNPKLLGTTKRIRESPAIIYYLVADSFLDIKKATDLVSTLKADGFKNAQIITDDSAVWYLVAYDETANKRKAQEKLKSIQNYYNPLAWLFIKNP